MTVSAEVPLLPPHISSQVRTLGLAIALDATPHATALLDAIEHAADEAGCVVLVADTHDELADEHGAIRELRARSVAGLLLSPSPGDDALINQLRRLSVPLVLVDRLASRSDVDQVGAENVQSTSTLVRHLAARGHRRIGLISGKTGLVSSDERLLGYRLGLGRAGLRFDPALIACGESTPGGAAQATSGLLDRDDPPTALVVADEKMLLGAQYEAHRRGVVIGSGLAIVGYGDPGWAREVDPPLTTMALPLEEIGREAVRLLLARIADQDRTPEQVRPAPHLLHRSSCGCWPTR